MRPERAGQARSRAFCGSRLRRSAIFGPAKYGNSARRPPRSCSRAISRASDSTARQAICRRRRRSPPSTLCHALRKLCRPRREEPHDGSPYLMDATGVQLRVDVMIVGIAPPVRIRLRRRRKRPLCASSGCTHGTGDRASRPDPRLTLCPSSDRFPGAPRATCGSVSTATPPAIAPREYDRRHRSGSVTAGRAHLIRPPARA